MTALADFEATIGEIARRSGPAVVGLGRGWGVGSGVVIAPGRVLTNAHNLRHDEITVTFVDGRRQSGGLAGSDPDLDIAVISVETGDVEPARWIAGEESGGAEPREANAAPGEASAASREAGAGSWAAGVDPSVEIVLPFKR